MTPNGLLTLGAVEPVVLHNRQLALQGVSDEDLTVLKTLLERIYTHFASPAQATARELSGLTYS